MRALLAEGADVDQRARGGQTALMLAAIFGRVEIARLLLAAGADVRLQDNLGLTAKEWAVRRGSAEVAQLLSNASPEEIVPSPKNAPPKQARPNVEAMRQSPAAEAKTTPPQDALSGKEGQQRTEADPERREAEQERRASATETKIEPQDDARRWIQGQLRIIADNERRKAEETRRAPASETKIAPQQSAPSVADEQQRTTPDPQHRQAEQVLRASPIETKIAPQQNASSVAEDQQRTKPDPQHRKAEKVLRATPIETKIAPQQTPPSVADEQQRTKPDPQHRKAEKVLRATPIETKIAPQQTPPSVADEQQKRNAESQRREAEQVLRASPIETKIAPQQTPPSVADEQQRTKPESQHREVEEARRPSPIETKTQQDAPSVNEEHQKTEAELEGSKAEEARRTATESARIEARLEHLRILEESSQRVEAEARAKSQRATRAALEREDRGISSGAAWGSQPSISDGAPYPLGRHVDRSERDTRREALPPHLSTRPAKLEPKTSESLNPPPTKRCPKCNATYENAQVEYCSYDATRLISAADPFFNPPAANDWARPTLWALVAIMAVGGSSIGYLISNYRSRENESSAPIAAQIEQPENARKDLPVIGGALSGMEVNVPEPEYPAKAKTEGVSGTITVQVQVNKNGRVTWARSSSGDRRLRAAAVKAAQRATFSAEKLAGSRATGTITYVFKL